QKHAVVVSDEVGDGVSGDGVVAHHDGLGTQFEQVRVEGVDEAVVVVDDENAGHVSAPTVPSSRASISCTHGNTHVTSAYRMTAASTTRMSTRTHQGPGR